MRKVAYPQALGVNHDKNIYLLLDLRRMNAIDASDRAEKNSIMKSVYQVWEGTGIYE